MMLFVCLLAGPAAAQQTPRKAGDTEMASLAQGWAALASGDLAQARLAAQRARTKAPNSASALALSVEVEIAGSGPVAGLNAYEQWLTTRKVEEAYVLRRVATAFLHAAARQTNPGPARTLALKALIADADPVATAIVQDARSVQVLLNQLQSAPSKIGTIKSLGDSGSRLAIPPLIDMLASGRDDDRAAAAEALGRLGAKEAVVPLQPLLNHENFTVRMRAAAALYQLGDDAGVPLLNQLLASEHSSVQIGAAEALSVRPGGGEWLTVARNLTADPDQSVQLDAARLVAPYDPPLAESVLARLGQADNLAVREEAARILAERVVSDYPTLRRQLRSQDGVEAVRAAARLLELVR